MNNTERLLDYLKKVSNMVATNAGYVYSTIEDFVLNNGQEYFRVENSLSKYPKHSDTAKECFKNAYELSVNYPNLTYCEGYIFYHIPIHHAWCIDENGIVIDPTINMITPYYGVAFNQTYVFETLLKSESYGVIDKPTLGFPLLKSTDIKFKY